MTSACDERSPCMGGEGEEPNEPAAPGGECRVRVYGGYSRLREALSRVMPMIYRYNDAIRGTGYYLKPVHKVYKVVGGVRRVYEYYGRYWWRRVKRRGRPGYRLVYAGTEKPREVPIEPPSTGLEGLSVIVEGDDVIIDCRVYEDFKSYFEGLRVERVT